jgi:predicted nucleic acid-binding protein
MIVTFVDAGVLIAAARGGAGVSEHAMAVLDDPNRLFASSEFVRLEVLPKALFNRKPMKQNFMRRFSGRWPSSNDDVVRHAYDIAVNSGLSALDALHVAAAISTGAEELVTTEKTTKPLHRAKDIRIRSIQAE